MRKFLRKAGVVSGLWALAGAIWAFVGHYGNLQTAWDIVKDWPTIFKYSALLFASWWFPLALSIACLAAWYWLTKRKTSEAVVDAPPPTQPPIVIHQQPQRSFFFHNLKERSEAQAAAKREKDRRHRDLLIKVRDFIKQTETSSVRERYDLFGAVIKYSDEIDSEEHLRAILSNLEHEFGNPFNVLEANSNNGLSGDWLSFLRDARIASYDIQNLNAAFGWAATRWKNSEHWKLGRRTMQLRESSAPSEEAEKCLNESAKLLQNDACQVFFSFNAICRAHAHLLKSNDELLWVCDELARHGHKHPFEGLTNHVPTEEWLEFVKTATLRPDIKTEDSGDYLNLAEEWPKLKGRPEPTAEIPLALTVLAEVLRRQNV
jgi:hypothetical protein